MNDPSQRPLSPHISIYKPQITSILSIMHRISGTGLSFALIFFVWFLMSLASGADAYDVFTDYAGSFVGVIALGFIILGLYFHLFNGIRHLIWDAGYGYDIPTVTKTGIGVITLTVLFTFITVTSLLS